jgi:hypothetical protein
VDAAAANRTLGEWALREFLTQRRHSALLVIVRLQAGINLIRVQRSAACSFILCADRVGTCIHLHRLISPTAIA